MCVPDLFVELTVNLIGDYMSVNHASFFKDCYVMQRGDVERFADALADGFTADTGSCHHAPWRKYSLPDVYGIDRHTNP